MRGYRFLTSLTLTLAVVGAGCGAPAVANPPAIAIPPSFDRLAAQVQLTGENVGGKILFVKDSNIWVYAEGRARQLTAGRSWRQPQWSPDGLEIAFVYTGANFTEIFVMNADGSDQRRLTRSQSSSLPDNDWVLRPAWSPDGQQIAYVSDSDTYHPTVWTMNKDGSGKRQLLRTTAFQEASDALSWSPDGKRLAITAFGHDVSQILLVEVPRGATQKVTDSPKGAFDPAWSPDGMTLAYAARESVQAVIHLRRLDGLSELEVNRGGLARAPAWSPGGSRLAYLSSSGGSFELYVVDVTADGSRLIASGERQLTRELSIDAASGLSWGK